MPNIKHCRECSWSHDKMKRIYIRENTPITEGYRRVFKAIGWKCENCNEIILDNNEKYIPFNKYHLLEFDYKQLLRNMEKQSLEEK